MRLGDAEARRSAVPDDCRVWRGSTPLPGAIQAPPPDGIRLTPFVKKTRPAVHWLLPDARLPLTSAIPYHGNRA